ncbi:MAG: hypothetical protein J7K72_03665 [Candidatus Aenigmarchaeota archaeon]|nr:hypothetical protein [Candidatus Aenigmarchaeota archaeon]
MITGEIERIKTEYPNKVTMSSIERRLEETPKTIFSNYPVLYPLPRCLLPLTEQEIREQPFKKILEEGGPDNIHAVRELGKRLMKIGDSLLFSWYGREIAREGMALYCSAAASRILRFNELGTDRGKEALETTLRRYLERGKRYLPKYIIESVEKALLRLNELPF